ncbi:hypothetical protein [Flavobacterium sp. CS20]|uniref:hypothetical protein n=1 Tax=Flavobacterium sp. CS20 TaxID=2775246 RepID=UPI001FFCC158|nr:hypothetical protein [Flavobacterium sp. CS20]
MKNLVLKTSLVLVVILISSSALYAQLPPGFGDTNVDDTTAPAPISGLVALGVIAGATIGIRKLKK